MSNTALTSDAQNSQPSVSLGGDSSHWTLTEFGAGQHQNRTLTLPIRPTTIGRSPDADIVVSDNSVSKLHAELSLSDEGLVVKDLGSRNGTFVNCKPIRQAVLKEGDLVQFANAVYRVGFVQLQAPQTVEQGILPWANTLLLFDELLSTRAVIPFFQPILDLREKATIGYEVLARSSLEGLKTPYAMFQAAERLNQHAALSELMRDEGLRIANQSSNASSVYFLNTHPNEVGTDRLIDNLFSLRNTFPETRIMLEIHEAAVVEAKAILRLRSVLAELSMQLSYDDFGAGQGRLVELGEVPPDVLKFDMGMIRDIDQAPKSKQELLATLVRVAKEIGSQTLAEGVETQAESEVCLAMGFDLVQGYFFGKPAPFQ